MGRAWGRKACVKVRKENGQNRAAFQVVEAMAARGRALASLCSRSWTAPSLGGSSRQSGCFMFDGHTLL